MLGHHLDGRPLCHAGVERVAQALEEGRHGVARHWVALHCSLDLPHMGLCDAADVLGPAGPVDLGPAFLHGLGVHSAFQIGHAEVVHNAELIALLAAVGLF